MDILKNNHPFTYLNLILIIQNEIYSVKFEIKFQLTSMYHGMLLLTHILLLHNSPLKNRKNLNASQNILFII